jgi:uncharacterized damage-inducible protein DinB
MPFAYYRNLSRAQQAIYRKSDSITEIRLPKPAELHPVVAALDAALTSENRAATQAASERLIRGLTDKMGVRAVRVEVLAARPHAGWGELHGLYTVTRGQTPKIQLWMRTAKQKRVVAFRTYLRTLLHEVGHHIDYALLGLADSFHTEGFYKRESSLFHQLVPERTMTMPTMEEVAKQPLEERLGRMRRTAEDLTAAIKGKNDSDLSRRPDAKNWAAKEVLCHLRDTEELFMERFQTIMANEEPKLGGPQPDRWAEERQYLRNDAGEALTAFRKRRDDSLAFLKKLAPPDWQRAGVSPTRGRITIDQFVSLMAWHDDNHLDQLKRALDGRA